MSALDCKKQGCGAPLAIAQRAARGPTAYSTPELVSTRPLPRCFFFTTPLNQDAQPARYAAINMLLLARHAWHAGGPGALSQQGICYGVHASLQRVDHVMPASVACEQASFTPQTNMKTPFAARSPQRAAPAQGSGARTGRGGRARTSAPWRRPPGPPHRCCHPPTARRPDRPARRPGARARCAPTRI